MNKNSTKINNVFKNLKGFTLIEIMVSVSVFSVIMLLTSSSIYTVFDANRKSQSLRSVMDNLNLSLESMTRTIRFGKDYHCDINFGDPALPRDCAGGANSIAVLDSNGTQVRYSFDAVNRKIVRIIGGVSQDVTGSDVTITIATFRVFGSTPYIAGAGTCPGSNDCLQPQVIIVVSGYSGAKATSRSSFNLQTTISQRIFDAR